ncbi:hypothetical protein HU830_03175 [Lactobacillus sp. DCY120]|uniref:Uncharacterized protein n=1 Tax=Bombilactobacillus apium TaxID=2675299 RepID=A0A850RBK5_9LACO|nr:hypothetical protein [Bombilactobacillus apium]NVY96178.1 hypothetical protein [Bombilactobacillus apium]
MMRHTHSREFLNNYLINRYETIKNEKIGVYSYEVVSKTVIKPVQTNFIQKINKLMYLYNKIERIEPENPYIVHWKFPTARNLQSNKIILRISGRRSVDYLEYIRRDQNFRLIYSTQKSVYDEDKEIMYSLFLCYCEEIIGKVYGKFGFILSLIDSGHEVDQLNSIIYRKIESLKKTSVIYLPNESFLQNKRFFPLVELKFNGDFETSNKVIKSEANNNIIDDIYIEMNKTKPEIRKINGLLSSRVERKHYIRTSAQFFQGLSFISRKQVDICSIVLKLSSYLDSSMGIIVLDLSKENMFLIKKNKDIIRCNDKYLINNPQSILHDAKDYLDISSSSYIFLLVSKADFCIESSRIILQRFIYSGEIFNKLGLILSEKNFVCRCLRNIDDKKVIKKINRDFPEYNIINYLMIAGIGAMDSILRMDI